MNLRRIAQTISRCVESPTARAQIYRAMVREVAEPGALKALEGIGPILDREIVQYQREHVPDPAPRTVRLPLSEGYCIALAETWRMAARADLEAVRCATVDGADAVAMESHP